MAKTLAKRAGMRSIGEVRCAADMEKRGIKYKYEPFKMWYTYAPKDHYYTPDFTVQVNDRLILEYKGKMTKGTRDKLVAIKESNPGKRICIIFEKPNNKLSSRKNSWRYWEWAEKMGFEWSEHYVKEEWLV
jgi:hypothetical protein